MTENEKSATERQVAKLGASTDKYRADRRRMYEADRARFDDGKPTSKATERQVGGLGHKRAQADRLSKADAKLDAALRAKGIDPKSLD